MADSTANAYMKARDANSSTSERSGALIASSAPMASKATAKPMWGVSDVDRADASNTAANNYRQSGATWI